MTRIRKSAALAALPGWRGRADLSQRALGRALGLSSTAMCHIEAGRAQPSLQVAIKLETLSNGEVPCMGWKVEE